MPNFASILKTLKYTPLIIGVIKQVQTKLSQQSNNFVHDTDLKIADVQGQLLRKLSMLENDNARLSQRLKEIDSAFATIKVVVWTSALLIIVTAIIALVALLK